MAEAKLCKNCTDYYPTCREDYIDARSSFQARNSGRFPQVAVINLEQLKNMALICRDSAGGPTITAGEVANAERTLKEGKPYCPGKFCGMMLMVVDSPATRFSLF